MRCPNCRTLTLHSTSGGAETATLVRCPRCPAVWLARSAEPCRESGPSPAPPPVTRRVTLIIHGEIAPGGLGRAPRSTARGPLSRRSGLRRYGIAAGAAALMLALVGVALLAPDVSALPGIALLEGGR